MSRLSRGDFPATRLAVLTAALATASSAPAAAQQSGQIWSYPSDGTWIPEVVSLGNRGTQVFTELGAYTNETLLLSAHDADPPAPVWAEGMVALNFARVVDSAERTDLHAAMHQVYVDGTNTQRKAVLRCYRSSEEESVWSYDFPVAIYGNTFSAVAVSRDGAQIVGAVYDTSIGRLRLATFSPGSPSPIGSGVVNTLGTATDLEISGDGTTAMLTSALKITIVQLPASTVAFEKYLSGSTNFGASALSHDGSRFAFGTTGEVWVYERSGGSYQLLRNHLLPAGSSCRALSLSSDGHRLAMGINSSASPATARVQLLDVASGAVLLDQTLTGEGTLQNQVAHVAISEDGDRFAVGLWGDEAELCPELLVYQRGQETPIYVRHLPGSVLDLDLSDDGSRVAVAHKGTHATEWGGGGAYRLFQVVDPDLWLEGVPRIGTAVEVWQDGRPGDLLRLLSSPYLSEPALPFPNVGELQLDRDTLSFHQPEGYGPDGTARYPLVIPNDSALVGTTRYYQGLCLTPRSLGEDVVAVTILP